MATPKDKRYRPRAPEQDVDGAWYWSVEQREWTPYSDEMWIVVRGGWAPTKDRAAAYAAQCAEAMEAWSERIRAEGARPTPQWVRSLPRLRPSDRP